MEVHFPSPIALRVVSKRNKAFMSFFFRGPIPINFPFIFLENDSSAKVGITSSTVGSCYMSLSSPRFNYPRARGSTALVVIVPTYTLSRCPLHTIV